MGTIKSHLAQKPRRVEIARISIICIFTPPLPIIYEKVRINGNINKRTAEPQGYSYYATAETSTTKT